MDVALGAGPIHVPSLNADDRRVVLGQLRPWVAQLVSRFQIDARVVPPCWEQHNAMVEALQALRDLERDCFTSNAPPSAAVAWFQGYREIEARLKETVAVTTCGLREHRDGRLTWADVQGDSAIELADPIGAPPTS
jgi:hypothetical protein